VRTRKVGTTDLIVSEIAFGCGGNAGLMVRGSQAEQLPILARALELGVNYFDNAPDYGDGLAETNLGIVLKSLGARPILNTKVEIRAENLSDVAGHVVRSAEASFAPARPRFMSICCKSTTAHRASIRSFEGRTYTQLSLDHFLRPGGALDGLERLKKAGKIRYAGSSAAAAMAMTCGNCSTPACFT